MNQPAFTPYNAMLFFITSFGMRYTLDKQRSNCHFPSREEYAQGDAEAHSRLTYYINYEITFTKDTSRCSARGMHGRFGLRFDRECR